MSDIEIQITLPDGSARSYPKGVTGMEIAESIGKRLARDSVGVRVDDVVCGLYEPIEANAEIAIVTRSTPESVCVTRYAT